MKQPALPPAFFALALVSLVLPAARPQPAAAVPTGYVVERVHDGLDSPVAIRFAPDGRLFFIERLTGRVMVYANLHSGLPTVWATLPVDNSGERGLLGMAFHPSFPDSPYVYFYHTQPSPRVNRVVRLENHSNLGFFPAVIVDNLPAGSIYHHSGRLAFGPDQMLYISFGDQTDPQFAEDPGNVRGKILRVTSLGQVPPDNPFGSANPAYVMGIRNVFGICFDPLTGEGYFTENGPTCDDEINHLDAGADYGWGPNDPCDGQPDGTRAAMKTFTPTIAPTGCCIYRSAFDPTFDGNLFFGSYNEGAVMRAVIDPADPSRIQSFDRTFISLPGEEVLDVTMGHDGMLWFSTSNAIYRLLPTTITGVEQTSPLAGFTARPNPFTGSITFDLPGGITLERLEVLDVGGRRVRHWDGPLRGTLLWKGEDDDGVRTAPGVYFVRLTNASGSISRRLVRLAR